MKDKIIAFVLTTREPVKTFYEKYDRYVNGVFRFLLGLVSALTVIYHTGYNRTVSSPFAALIIAVICAFLPPSMITVACCLLMLVEFTSVSLEVAAIAGIFMILMLFMYFVFKAENSYLMIITLVLCLFGFSPLILPIGLILSPIEVLVITFGIFYYGFVIVVKKDFSVLSKQTGNYSLGGRINLLLTDIITSDKFLLVLLSVVMAVILITVVRKIKISHAPLISVILGDFLFLVSMLLGSYFIEVEVRYGLFFISFLLNILLSAIIIFYIINLDYRHTENVQFEDEEYYYFVKAIPKISISKKETKLGSITDIEQSFADTMEINTDKVFLRHDYEGNENGGQ